MLECVIGSQDEVFNEQQGASAESSPPIPDDGASAPSRETRQPTTADQARPSAAAPETRTSAPGPSNVSPFNQSSQSSSISSRSPAAAVYMPPRPPLLSARNTLPSSSAEIPSADVGSTQPRPKRLRPSELNNLHLYQETIRSQPVLSSRITRTSSNRSGSGSLHASTSDRWSTLKNIRNVTTGSLDLGNLPILVSPDLVDQFLEISSHNSNMKIETGGLLGGIVEDSVAFKVTTLVIPKQNGKSDYWEAIDEVAIQTYFTNHGLILLGCIHSHPPPWTSFLSSVDLHQLFDFQKENSSSISIVVAPAHMPTDVPAFGYSLTDMGLTVISDCRKKGVHQHRYTIPCFFSFIIPFYLKGPKPEWS